MDQVDGDANLKPITAEIAASDSVALRPMPRRKIKIPIILFLLTCLSTFWVGITDWRPTVPLYAGDFDSIAMAVRIQVLENWDQGLLYMASVLLILLLHEFGHFFATIYYRVPATAPIFLPFPLNPMARWGQ